MHRKRLRRAFHGRRFRRHFELQSVVRQLHVRVARLLQPRICRLMRQIVRNVREPRPFRPQSVDQRQRLLHRLVHRVRHVPQRIQNQIVQIFQQRHARFRQPAEVRHIRRAPKPESQHIHFPVQQWHRNKRNPQQRKRSVHLAQFHARQAAQCRLMVEHIRKHAPHHAKRFLRPIHRDRRLLPVVVRPQIIESQNMVRVAMRQQHPVQPVHSRAQRLRAKVRRRVDHHILSVAGKQQGRAQSLVARVRRIAHCAMAPQCRHTHRCARPQHHQPYLLFRLSPHPPIVPTVRPVGLPFYLLLFTLSLFHSFIFLFLTPLQKKNGTTRARPELRKAVPFHSYKLPTTNSRLSSYFFPFACAVIFAISAAMAF